MNINFNLRVIRSGNYTVSLDPEGSKFDTNVSNVFVEPRKSAGGDNVTIPCKPEDADFWDIVVRYDNGKTKRLGRIFF
jgi:hypothetical protein